MVYYSKVILKDAKRYIYKVLVQIVQMWHLDNGAKRYIYKVLVQIVQMWHVDNGAKRYIHKVLVQMVQMWHLDNLTKKFGRLRRADCLVLISSLR